MLTASDKNEYIPVVQEEVIAYETGAKLTLEGASSQINMALFYYDYNNKQLRTSLLDPIFGALPVLKNTPKSNVKGVELSLTSQLPAGFSLLVAGSVIDTEIEEFISTNIEGEEENFSGKPFNLTPKYQASVMLNQQWELADWRIISSATYVYTGSTNATLDEDPRYEMPSWNTFDANVNASPLGSSWSLGLFARNITDELYTVSANSIADAVVRYTGFPRAYGVSFEIDFE